MPAQNYTVTSSAPLHISEQPVEVLVLNSGSSIIYLDGYPGMSSSNGFPLNPGATKIWERQTPLYAITASGTSTLNVTSNTGGLFDPSAIATGITGGTTLSPTAIATAITGGTTLSPAAIAAQINIVGVPIVDQPSTLLNTTSFTLTSSLGTVNVSSILDVTSYQGFSLQIQFTGTGTPNTRKFSILWYQDLAGTTQVDQDDFELVDGNVNPYCKMTGITRAPYMQVIAPGTGVAMTVINNVTVTIVAFKRALRERFLSNANVVGGSTLGVNGAAGLALATLSPAAGVSTDYYPVCYAGRGTMTLYLNGAITGPIFLVLKHIGTGLEFANVSVASGALGGTAAMANVSLPRAPIQMTTKNNDTAARTYRVALTMEG